jgi:hypothetical protein
VRFVAAISTALLALPALASPARADNATPLRFEVGLALGYAFPAGATEAGNHLRDETFGLAALHADVAVRLTRRIGIALWARYGVGIPTLCATAADCMGSLGSDVALALRVRMDLPAFGRFAPRVDFGSGYGWFTSGLADSGASSSRAYHGPLLLSAAVALPFRLSEHWTFGPELDASAGAFVHLALDTPSGSSGGSIGGRAVHGWIAPALRLAASL